MALLSVPEEKLKVTDAVEITRYLANCGIDYERWNANHAMGESAAAAEILDSYAKEIATLKARGGYVTADVIDVNPETPGLEAMLAKFHHEHWHDEDEVRFILAGRGLFHIHPQDLPIVAIEVEAGDLIRVPRGTLHWFNLCANRRIRAIRLFQDMAGWTPHYTSSGRDESFQPVCFGITHLPRDAGAVL